MAFKQAIKRVCLKASKRACLKPSSVYECMSNFTKKFVVHKHTGKRSPGAFLFTFSVLCEGGGYFGEALKHVCMPQTYIHKSNIHTQLVDLPYRKAFPGALERVCMFENPLPVMENCFKHTYMHAQKQVCVATKILLKHLLSLYVCFKSLSLSWKWNINAQTYTLKFHQKSNLRSIQKALKHVCMFENPEPVMEIGFKQKPSDDDMNKKC